MELPEITQSRSQPVGAMYNNQYHNGHVQSNAPTLNNTNRHYLQTPELFQTTGFCNQTDNFDDNIDENDTDTDSEDQSEPENGVNDNLLGQNHQRNRTITTGKMYFPQINFINLQVL